MASRLIIEEDIMGQEERNACADAQASWMACLFIHMSIANLTEIECAYGIGARESAFELLRGSVRQLLGTERIEEHSGKGTVEVTLRLGARCGNGLAASIAERIRAVMMATQLSNQNDLFIAIPCITSAVFQPGRSERDAARSKAHALAARSCSAINHSLDWAKYRENMNRGAMLLANLKKGKAVFARQDILSTVGAPTVLYQENLLRICDDGGKLRGCEGEIMALEQLGIAYELDSRLVSHALDHLEIFHNMRLGVNISARSAALHGSGQGALWHDILHRLQQCRQVAERLVIEITETADFLSIEEALEFVKAVQQAGARIAVDDFGSGKRSIHQLAVLKADIIKIDAIFVQSASRSSRGFATFLHLVRLSSTLGSTVVVEGIETAKQADMARKAGATGLQGFFLNRPIGAIALTESPHKTNILRFEPFRARRMRSQGITAYAERTAQTSERESHVQD